MKTKSLKADCVLGCTAGEGIGRHWKARKPATTVEWFITRDNDTEDNDNKNNEHNDNEHNDNENNDNEGNDNEGNDNEGNSNEDNG